jgi:molybdate transport system regulatory protein
MIDVDCHISIKKNGVCFLDPTKIDLLTQIKQSGSLRAAAKKCSISYQHAWTIINDLNNAAPEPLVIKQRGGSNGGGAELSHYGQKIILEYYLIKDQLQKQVDRINVEINL